MAASMAKYYAAEVCNEIAGKAVQIHGGYGFIKDLTSGEKYFFHVSSAPAGISEGNTVTFETERSARGMNAINITLTK